MREALSLRVTDPGRLRIVPFDRDWRAEWNRFVTVEAVNGHFMHTRDFLDYHGDRFADHSLVFVRNGRLVAVLAAHREGDVLASHRGLTFGGLVVGEDFGNADCAEAFAALGHHMLAAGLRQLDYRPVPVWYHRAVFEVDCGLLGGRPAYFPAAVCAMETENGFNATRRNLLQRARKEGLEIDNGAELLPAVMGRVAEVLAARHQAVPVHTVAELEHLRSLFPEGIRCYAVRRPGEDALLAGIILFVAPHAVKLQYVGYAENTGESGAMEAVYDHVLRLPEFRGRSFDFGTSATENGIDATLMAYKESLGGRLRMVARMTVDPGQLITAEKR